MVKSWIFSFIDLLSLLLVFFIMIYASSTMNVNKEEPQIEKKVTPERILQATNLIDIDYLEKLLNYSLATSPVLFFRKNDDLIIHVDLHLLYNEDNQYSQPGRQLVNILHNHLFEIDNNISILYIEEAGYQNDWANIYDILTKLQQMGSFINRHKDVEIAYQSINKEASARAYVNIIIHGS